MHSRSWKRSSLAAGFLVAVAVAAQAQGTSKAPSPTAAAQAAAPKLTWGPAPAVFAPGAKMAVVSGNPGSTGQYVVQLQMPANYKIAPHFHPTDEHVKVVSGNFMVGMGDTVDAAKMKSMHAGDTITAPAQMHHYASVKGKTIVEVSGTGPFQLTYVNPADMPKAKKGK
jgi:quercetin dioxygenase-like cupin family protein